MSEWNSDFLSKLRHLENLFVRDFDKKIGNLFTSIWIRYHSRTFLFSVLRDITTQLYELSPSLTLFSFVVATHFQQNFSVVCRTDML